MRYVVQFPSKNYLHINAEGKWHDDYIESSLESCTIFTYKEEAETAAKNVDGNVVLVKLVPILK